MKELFSLLDNTDVIHNLCILMMNGYSRNLIENEDRVMMVPNANNFPQTNPK